MLLHENITRLLQLWGVFSPSEEADFLKGRISSYVISIDQTEIVFFVL